MNLRRVDLNLLTVFDAVMTEGNMSRAADKIGMSQPALSLAMSRFRPLVDDQLFVRSGHGVRPTPRAKELAGPVRRALNIIGVALQEEGDFDPATSDRSFNLALADAGELLILPRLMQQLESCNSSIRINTIPLGNDDIHKEMLSGGVDLLLWIEPFASEGGSFVSKQIGTESNVCLVRKDHPTVGEQLSYEQFAELKHIILRLPGSYGPAVIDRELWAHDLQREHTMTVHSLYSYPRVLSSTDMVGTVPSSVAHSFASVHNLRVLPSPFSTELPVYLAWPQSLDTDSAHQWLRESVIDIYQNCAKSEQ